MDDIVMRVARTLASSKRLQILSRLAVEGETSPSRLGRALHMPLNALSGHLARLVTAGLIKRRRSGGWSYCVADSPYGPTTLSGKTMAWLRKVLTRPERTLVNCGEAKAHRLSAKEAQTRVHELVFEAATAFTDLRRIQILRHLATGKEVNAEALCRELSMSDAAVRRHTNKLLRRGYLSPGAAGRSAVYRLAGKFKTPIHAGLLAIVRATWGERNSRTS